MPLDLPLFSDVKGFADAAQVKLDAILQRLDNSQSSTALAAINAVLTSLTSKLENLMTTQAELVTGLGAVSDQITKIGTETQGLQQKIADLVAAVANSGVVSPELEAAVDALKAQVQVVDDLVADTVVPTPPEPNPNDPNNPPTP